MSVKPELAFDVCWEVYRGAREVLEAKRGMSAMDWKEATKYLWRPDFRPRLAEWVADPAVLPGPCAVRKRAALSRLERAKLGDLVGRSTPPLRKRAATPRHVPATKIFQQRGLTQNAS